MTPRCVGSGREMLLVLAGLSVLATAQARLYSDREIHQLPRLYRLDDYDRCLARPGALFCSGTFQLSADQPSRLFDLIQEYSAELVHYDRKLLHRGYCVSERCPSNERNSSWRFERCVQQETRALGLKAALLQHHCDFAVSAPLPPDYYQRVYLGVVAIILCLNFFGTLHDFACGSNTKSRFLSAWSMRANWRRLTAKYEDGDPRLSALSPIQGFRVMMLLIVMLTHTVQITIMLYLHNPQYIEQTFNNPLAMIMRNGTAVMQIFFVISNFLFGYIMLLQSQKAPISLAQYPISLIYRFFRLAPVHLLVVGFAATWWPHLGSGPQWAESVGEESAICRRKLPLHAAFIHNFVDAENHCLLQTWYLAVEFQMYVVSSLVMLTLLQLKVRPLPVLAALFALACALTTGLVHLYQWKSLLYIMIPKNVVSMFRGIPSFSQLFIGPWSSLPAAFLGLLLAQMHFQIQEAGYKLTSSKIFLWLCHASVPLYVSCLILGNVLIQYTDPLSTFIYTSLERPLFGLISCICILGFTNNVDNVFHRALNWRGWQTAGRLSLAVLALHWCVTKALLSSRQTLTEASFLHILRDAVTVSIVTYCLAVPVTVLVEFPFIRMTRILSS